MRSKRTNPPSKAPHHEDASPSPSAPPLDSADYSYNPDTFKDIDDVSTIKTGASVSGMRSMVLDGLGVISEDESTAKIGDKSKKKLSKAFLY